MPSGNYEIEYMAFVDAETKRSKRSADRAMYQYVILRLAMVIVGSSLPAVITINKDVAAFCAVLLAILAALDTQFQWGDEWRQFRTTELELGRLVRQYQHQSRNIDRKVADQPSSSQSSAFDRFVTEVEALLRDDTNKFFRFRITRWKGNDKSADDSQGVTD